MNKTPGYNVSVSTDSPNADHQLNQGQGLAH